MIRNDILNDSSSIKKKNILNNTDNEVLDKNNAWKSYICDNSSKLLSETASIEHNQNELAGKVSSQLSNPMDIQYINDISIPTFI